MTSAKWVPVRSNLRSFGDAMFIATLRQTTRDEREQCTNATAGAISEPKATKPKVTTVAPSKSHSSLAHQYA